MQCFDEFGAEERVCGDAAADNNGLYAMFLHSAFGFGDQYFHNGIFYFARHGGLLVVGERLAFYCRRTAVLRPENENS